jgi:hypothetical protein
VTLSGYISRPYFILLSFDSELRRQCHRVEITRPIVRMRVFIRRAWRCERLYQGYCGEMKEPEAATESQCEATVFAGIASLESEEDSGPNSTL